MATIMRTNSENREFIALIRLLDSELKDRYGALQSEYDHFNVIEPNNTVVIAYSGNRAVGCGCFKAFDEFSVEIKRMFVKPAYRKKGLARKILSDLEKWAAESGFSAAVLETGKNQPEAIAMYESSGYLRIPNFGQYAGMPNSVCMKKRL